MPSLAGQYLGRYHIIEQLGEGGMATVFRADDTRLERDVAIKVIRKDNFSPNALQEVLKRFEREAKALASLSHSHIVKVFDYGEYDGAPYLVMEFVPAGTLKEHTGSPMPWSQAARLLLPIARALAYAHERGFIHRDVKPSNILITDTGDPMLTDFGIAKILEAEGATTLTGTGVGIGTPEYMAPEQGTGQNIDARADVYALGVVFYEMLTGRRPYEADTPMAVMLKHVTDPLPRPREYNPDLPDVVEGVLLKALAKQPEDRYADMWAFLNALDKLLQGGEIESSAISTEERGASTPHIEPAPWRQSLTRWPWPGSVVLAVAVICLGLAGFYISRKWAPGSLPLPTATQPAAATSPPASAPWVSPTPPAPTSALPSETPTPAPSHTAVHTNTASPTPSAQPSSTHSMPPPPTPIGGGGLIAFNSNRGGLNDIYVMNSDGSGVVQLTFSPSDERTPYWSPDGEEVAYQSNQDGDYEIYITNPDTNQTRQVTRNDCNDYAPAWSADGRMLVFYSDCDGNREIYTINIDGSDRRQLTHSSGIYNWFPTWSPDGRQITFSSNRGGKYEVYVMNADGSAQRALAPGCISSFSPDGQMIVFTQYCTDTGYIYIMGADGSNLRTLVDQYENTNPSWSRDGRMIIFQSERDGNDDIWMVDLQGDNWTKLTSDPAEDACPVWQPGSD